MHKLILFFLAFFIWLSSIAEAGRMYDPEIARFTTPDPALFENAPNDLFDIADGRLLMESPYSYGHNNPIRYIDPDGKTPWDILDIGFAIWSVSDFVQNPTWANFGWAALDVAAAALPIAPSSGYFRRGAQATSTAMDMMRRSDKAEDLVTVYRSVDEAGNVQYVGITNDMSRRAGEHLRGKGIRISEVDGLQNLSRTDAKAVEQVLIEHHRLGKDGGTLMNRINSIATDNPDYARQLERGRELLEQAGIRF